jgi:hypothetical protein
MMCGWFIIVILLYCCVCFVFHTCLVVFVVERFVEEQGQHSLFGAEHHMIGSKQAVRPLVMVDSKQAVWPLVMVPCGYHAFIAVVKNGHDRQQSTIICLLQLLVG